MKQKLIAIIKRWITPVIEIRAGDKATLVFQYPLSLPADEVLQTWEILAQNMPDCVVVMIPEEVKFHKAILRR